MQLPNHKEMLEAGVHIGHLRRKWNPKMRPFIFQEHRGIHLIDLNKTSSHLEEAGQAAKALAKAGKKIMYVATKKQASELVAHAARTVNMPYVTDRWLGGMMTNFTTIRKSVKKMKNIERMLADGSLTSVTKKERLTLTREHEKLNKVLGGIEDLNRLPHAVFIIDPSHEHLALNEAHKLNIRTLAIVDTNCDPTSVDWAVPANDDSSRSVALLTNYITECIKEGLAERATEKAEQKAVEQKEVKA